MPVTSAVRELKQIPFEHLIGGPLKAAISSQALAAKTTVDFIREVGFKPAGDAPDMANVDDPFGKPGTSADIGEVRTVTFNYEKLDETDGASSFKLTVPILTITPVPYIRIDEMTIDFKATLTDLVTSRSSSQANVSSSISGSYGSFWTPVKVTARVSASYKTTSSSASAQKREYEMSIHVRAVQDEMPAGLSRILDILEDAIEDAKDATTPTPTPTPG